MLLEYAEIVNKIILYIGVANTPCEEIKFQELGGPLHS